MLTKEIRNQILYMLQQAGKYAEDQNFQIDHLDISNKAERQHDLKNIATLLPEIEYPDVSQDNKDRIKKFVRLIELSDIYLYPHKLFTEEVTDDSDIKEIRAYIKAFVTTNIYNFSASVEEIVQAVDSQFPYPSEIEIQLRGIQSKLRSISAIDQQLMPQAANQLSSISIQPEQRKNGGISRENGVVDKPAQQPLAKQVLYVKLAIASEELEKSLFVSPAEGQSLLDTDVLDASCLARIIKREDREGETTAFPTLQLMKADRDNKGTVRDQESANIHFAIEVKEPVDLTDKKRKGGDVTRANLSADNINKIMLIYSPLNSVSFHKTFINQCISALNQQYINSDPLLDIEDLQKSYASACKLNTAEAISKFIFDNHDALYQLFVAENKEGLENITTEYQMLMATIKVHDFFNKHKEFSLIAKIIKETSPRELEAIFERIFKHEPTVLELSRKGLLSLLYSNNIMTCDDANYVEGTGVHTKEFQEFLHTSACRYSLKNGTLLAAYQNLQPIAAANNNAAVVKQAPVAKPVAARQIPVASSAPAVKPAAASPAPVANPVIAKPVARPLPPIPNVLAPKLLPLSQLPLQAQKPAAPKASVATVAPAQVSAVKKELNGLLQAGAHGIFSKPAPVPVPIPVPAAQAIQVDTVEKPAAKSRKFTDREKDIKVLDPKSNQLVDLDIEKDVLLSILTCPYTFDLMDDPVGISYIADDGKPYHLSVERESYIKYFRDSKSAKFEDPITGRSFAKDSMRVADAFDKKDEIDRRLGMLEAESAKLLAAQAAAEQSNNRPTFKA